MNLWNTNFYVSDFGINPIIWSANADKNTFCKFCVLLRKNILPFKVPDTLSAYCNLFNFIVLFIDLT